MTSTALANRESILQQVAEGKRLGEIAQAFGVSKQALSKQLSSDPAYQEALTCFHSSRLDDAEVMILSATEQVDIARASQYWRAVSWRAERTLSSVYGQQATPGQSFGTQGITINIGTVQPGHTVEHDSLSADTK